MSKDTSIEWCHHTFNPWWGCAKVSEACRNCYAETLATRTGRDFSQRVRTKESWTDVLKWDNDARRRGVRERVFVGSMCDVAEDHPDVNPWQGQALEMLGTRLTNLDVLLLTKRPENLRRLLYVHWTHGRLPKHIWVGCTVENQRTADARIPELMRIPAAVRFLSVEPILGAVRLPDDGAVDWVICGGESGPRARCPHPKAIRDLRDQCGRRGIPFLFKQWGEYAPMNWRTTVTRPGDVVAMADGRQVVINQNGHIPNEMRGFDVLRRVGKHAAGRELDGTVHDEYPVTEILPALDGLALPRQPELPNFNTFREDVQRKMIASINRKGNDR